MRQSADHGIQTKEKCENGSALLCPDASPPHSLSLQNRQFLEVSGVARIISCDETAAVLETSAGNLTVGGSGLQISELSVQTGNVRLQGKIEYLQYAENRTTTGGLFARLFH